MIAERLEELFGEAIELPPTERTRFLERTCGSDLASLRRLVAMVETHTRAEHLAFFASKIPSPASEQPGQRIGPYLLREQLGEGGWGVVFLAEQEKPVRRRVALKVIKAGLDTRRVIARFEAEQETLSRMDHANIAKVLDAGATQTGRLYFVMELVSGPRITEYCDQNKLQVSDRLELFAKVCQAVQHAHQKGIIHRDLKPSNILVADHDGMPVPMIIDFGIAKATEGQFTDSISYTGGLHLLGTPAYMSPEQTAIPNADVDTRSDIYSLGVLLYELLLGKTPIDARKLQESSWEEMCRTIREKESLRPSALLATLPDDERTATALTRGTDPSQLARLVLGDLDWIVMKCLAKERARRYETANSLALDVRRHLAFEPVLARPPGVIYRLQRLVVRNKLAVATMGAVAIALLIGLTVALLGWRFAWSEREKAERNLYDANMNLAARDLAVGNRGHALELLGLYRPGTGRAPLRGWEWRHLWKRCQGQEQFSLLGHRGRVVALVFSPDNKTLFSGDTGGVVRIWDLNLRKEVGRQRVGHDEWIGPLALAISPDGKALIIASPDGVTICDGPSFARERKLPGAKHPMALSPDGGLLVTGGIDGAIVWDPASLKILHGSTSVIPPRTQITFSPDGSLFAIPVETGGKVEIQLWKTASLREKGFQESPVSVLQRGTNETPVTGLAFSQNAKILATGALEKGDQRGLQLWDTQTGQPLSPLKPRGEVLNMAFLPGDKTLLTFKPAQDFRLWDISARTNIALLRVIPGHENEIWSVAFSPSGRTVASGSKDGMIKIWNLDAFQEPRDAEDQIEAHNIAELGFSQDGRIIHSLSADSALVSWDAQTLQHLDSGKLLRPFRVAAISPPGTRLAVGLTNGAVEVWRIDEPNRGPQLIRKVLPPQPKIFEPFFLTAKKGAEQSPSYPLMAWSGDGKQLAVFVNRLYVWDISTGQSDRQLALPSKPDAIALSPNGEMLASASGTRIELWELRTGRRLATWLGHKEPALELAFSPDGKTLATVSFDNTAALWDVSSRSLRSSLTSHSSAVFHLAFSPDGRTLVTRGADDTLKLWHVRTGTELMTIPTPPSNWGPHFCGIRFSPSGAVMAVGGQGQIQVYRAPSLAEIDAADARRTGK